MKYIVWGIGERLENCLKSLKLDNVVAFVDQKATDNQMEYLGKPLDLPEKILCYEWDYIVVSSNKYFDEISKRCIVEFGIDCRKIVRLEYILGMEKNDFSGSKMQLEYRDVKKLVDGWEQASVIKNWWGKSFFGDQKANAAINCRGYIYPILLENLSINIYQVTHKLFHPIGNNKYIAIGVGKDEMPYLRDHTGENIAKYNELINECTALYWIWKNSEAEYLGLNHYRRVFESELNEGWPLQDVEALLLLQQYDVIVSKAIAFVNNSVKLILSKEVCQEAFEVSWKEITGIFDSRSINEKEAFEKIMSGNIIFPCNMFIMNRKKVDEYCSWIFPILFELIDRVQIKEEWDVYSKRILGFWAERLFTVWLYLGSYKIKELPILLTDGGSPYGK